METHGEIAALTILHSSEDILVCSISFRHFICLFQLLNWRCCLAVVYCGKGSSQMFLGLLAICKMCSTSTVRLGFGISKAFGAAVYTLPEYLMDTIVQTVSQLASISIFSIAMLDTIVGSCQVRFHFCVVCSIVPVEVRLSSYVGGNWYIASRLRAHRHSPVLSLCVRRVMLQHQQNRLS